jgi:hypothetical protein
MNTILLLQKLEEAENILAKMKHEALWKPIRFSGHIHEDARRLKYLLSVVENLFLKDTEAITAKAPILQTPCKAKFASEANDSPSSEADGAFG